MANPQKLGALLAITPLIASATPAVAGEFYETIEDGNNNKYCIGSTTGTLKWNGTGVDAEWSLTGQTKSWWLGYGLSGSGNSSGDDNLPDVLSQQEGVQDLTFYYKTSEN